MGAGFLAAAAALLVTAAGFVPWLKIVDPTGTVSVSGWGQLSGDTQLTGTNINDLFGELGASVTYRPAQFVSVVAGFALIAGLVLAARVSRPAGAVLALVGLYAVVWGTIRLFSLGAAADVLVGDPADAAADAAAADQTGSAVTGTASAGVGPWLTLSGGLVLTAVAAALFLGWLGHRQERA
ncbi:hypothetical protein D1871_12860 [Nakamurella silvestris]|nr:hypothetical protein D1871_12860 [Nakamurella silvestris]